MTNSPSRPPQTTSVAPVDLLDHLAQPVVALDADLQLTYRNRALRDLLPGLAELGPGADILDLFSALRSVFRNGDELTLALARITEDQVAARDQGLLARTPDDTLYALDVQPIGDPVSWLILFRDVTEEQAEHSRLQAVNRELDSLVYTISHDLKNPLAVVQGVTELLEAHFAPALGREGHEFIQMLKQESSKMLVMIDDILQISRLHRGKVDMEEVDTNDLVNSIVGEFQHVYRDIAVVFIIQDDLPVIHAQPTMLAQVFKNLLSNAIKYSDEAKPRTLIEVGCRSADGWHRFFVRDNGMGMTTEEQHHVFDPFYRVGDKDIDGTGLGTAIIKKVVEAHGGVVTVESTKGQGSCFSFTLPA